MAPPQEPAPIAGGPPRVLHIVENLDRGAVEGWLVRMLAHGAATGSAPDWTFYCALGEAGSLDDRARGLGAGIVYSPVKIASKGAFLSALRHEARRGGYEVVHCHHDIVSGLYLLGLFGLPIRRRLVHVHNADENVLTPDPVKQRLYREPLRRVSLTLADRIVGISNHTLDTFLGGRERRPCRDLVHYYGVDPAPFRDLAADRVGFRRRLDLAPDALVMLFGGRITPEKNPAFTIDVLHALRRHEPRAVAVFAGAGSLEGEVMDRARALGVAEAVRMIGWRSDLPEVMGCSDLFILPRPEAPMEGFGLAVLEAQLAGLRLLLSLGIPDDPLLPGALFRRLSLSSGPEVWAAAALELLRGPAPSRPAALAALSASPMDMDRAWTGLEALLA